MLPLLLSALFISSAAGQSCPSGFTFFESACYGFVNHPMKWADAQSTCSALGGFLVEIFNANVNQFVQKLATDNKVDAIWLGADDLLAEGAWTWSKSGALVDEYTDWAPGQPDSDSSGDENCMEMNVDHFSSHWNDDECDHKQPFVCQRLLGDDLIGR